MSIGGALELIQSFNNPEIIELLTAGFWRVSLTVGGSFSLSSDLIQLPKLFIEILEKLFSGAFKVII